MTKLEISICENLVSKFDEVTCVNEGLQILKEYSNLFTRARIKHTYQKAIKQVKKHNLIIPKTEFKKKETNCDQCIFINKDNILK